MMKIKSITDVITNSSSEVFILDTPKSPEQVAQELATFTSGFGTPFTFRLEDYRKAMEDESDSWDNPYKTHIDGWWTDPNDPEAMKEYAENAIEHASLRQVLTDDYVIGDRTAEEMQMREDFFNRILEVINENLPALTELARTEEGRCPWWLKKDAPNRELSDYDITWLFRFGKWNPSPLSEFIHELIDPIPIPEPFKVLREEDDITKLEGKIIVPCGENSCPYETWDRINEDYNGYNKHLG